MMSSKGRDRLPQPGVARTESHPTCERRRSQCLHVAEGNNCRGWAWLGLFPSLLGSRMCHTQRSGRLAIHWFSACLLLLSVAHEVQ